MPYTEPGRPADGDDMLEQPGPVAKVEQPRDDMAAMLERVATNPDADVQKLETLIAMRERVLATEARAAFYRQFAKMQVELPEIDREGTIDFVDSRGNRRFTKYARNEDIQAAIKPILGKFGFSLRFRVTFPDRQVFVRGILSHEAGHSEETEFLADPDNTGKKNAIQALASSQSYGQRYCTNALLNLTSRGDDDDGVAGGAPEPETQPDDPKYQAWLTTLREHALAREPAAMYNAFSAGTPEHRNRLTLKDSETWLLLKRDATAEP